MTPSLPNISILGQGFELSDYFTRETLLKCKVFIETCNFLTVSCIHWNELKKISLSSFFDPSQQFFLYSCICTLLPFSSIAVQNAVEKMSPM